MNELLNEFEIIIILKTIIFDIDLNFLDENDLNKIATYAEDMGVDLNYKLFDNLSYPNYDEMYEVYDEWKNDVLYMFEDIRNSLLKKLEWEDNMPKRRIYLDRYEKALNHIKTNSEIEEQYLKEAKKCFRDIKHTDSKLAIKSYFNHIDFVLENSFGVKVILP